MSDDQAQRAIQQLYEDTSSRDELSDDEANVLLAWGETQIKALAGKGLDDSAFDEAFDHLRGVMKNINRYTGQRSYATPEDLTALLNELAGEAQALGVHVQAQELAIPTAQAADDNIALINAMTALVTPGAHTSAQAQAQTVETQPPAEPASPPAPAASETIISKAPEPLAAPVPIPTPPVSPAPTAAENIAEKPPEPAADPEEKPDDSEDEPKKPNLFDQLKKLF